MLLPSARGISNAMVLRCCCFLSQCCPQSVANLEAAIILAAICARVDLALAPGQVRAACSWVRAEGWFEGNGLTVAEHRSQRLGLYILRTSVFLFS